MSYKLALSAVLVTGGLTAMVVPTPDELAQQKAADRAASMAASASAQAPASTIKVARSYSPDVVLDRAEDGHFYANAQVNGRQISMLVDTGASVIALTGEDARTLGIYWDTNDITYVAQGAAGPVEGVNTVIERLSVGGHEVANVQAIIIPEGARISLLGQSYLRTLDRVEMSGDQMTLGKGDN
jgi:aspartyl protease family protein